MTQIMKPYLQQTSFSQELMKHNYRIPPLYYLLTISNAEHQALFMALRTGFYTGLLLPVMMLR